MRFNSFHYIALTIIMLFFQSCEQNSYFSNTQDCENYDYSDCNTAEPSLIALNIKLTINNENLKIPVIIYEGKLEQNQIVLTDTVTTSKYSVLLPADKYYTVSARYISGNKIIYCIGGDKVKKMSNYVCDSVCWSVQEGNVNVELKY